jgi:hypothetical protein
LRDDAEADNRVRRGPFCAPSDRAGGRAGLQQNPLRTSSAGPGYRHRPSRRDCHSAWIDTLNPKALELYQRLGYEVFGELKDYPVGGSRFFLQKKLGPII